MHTEPVAELGCMEMPHLENVDDSDLDDEDDNEMKDPQPEEEEEGEEPEEQREDEGEGESQSKKNSQFVPPPSLELAKAALTDIKAILRLPRNGREYKDSDLQPSLQVHLEAMHMFLWKFCDAKSMAKGRNGSKWTAPSLDTAYCLKKGPYYARKLREWTHAFILD